MGEFPWGPSHGRRAPAASTCFLGVSCTPAAGAALGQVPAGSQAMGAEISVAKQWRVSRETRGVSGHPGMSHLSDTCAQTPLAPPPPPPSSQRAEGGSSAGWGGAWTPELRRCQDLELGCHRQRPPPSPATCWLCGPE